MEEIKREQFSDIHLSAGDSITFTVRDDDTGEVLFRHREDATEPMLFNEAAVYRFEKAFGMKNGHALVAGESL